MFQRVVYIQLNDRDRLIMKNNLIMNCLVSLILDFLAHCKKLKSIQSLCISSHKPHSHCADVATVHPDSGQSVYRDAPGHIS